jgi:uncharacterized membrane protein required for colicin V production
MDTILHFLQTTPVSDWVLFIAIIFLAIIGFFRGGAKILIHSIWAVFGIIIASIFYESLANSGIFNTLGVAEQLIFFISFIALFILFFILKLLIYKALSAIAKIHGPCPLNRFIALVIGFGFAVVLSWYITMDISSLEVVYRIITNELMRIFLSFLVIFTIVLVLALAVGKLLNVKVGIDRPCPLIVALQPLDGILNAKNINSALNNIEGMIFSILQGLVLLIIAIIINNQFAIITIEYQGLLAHINEIAIMVQDVLSDYLLFINKN